MERIKQALEKARAGQQRSRESKPALKPVVPDPPGIARPDIQIKPVDPVSLKRHRIIAGDKNTPETTSFDMLRTQVLREMREREWRTLAVTSPLPACGKTTIAINLALSMAQQTEPSVLLGDFDLRRPKIGEYLGIDADPDLSDFLEGRVPFESVLVDPGIPRLLIAPNTKVYRNAAEMLTTPAVKSLVKDLRSEYSDRINIFDLPPMLTSDDMIAFLPNVDCILLVVADGLTKKPELEETLRLLEGANLLGVVLNKSDVGLQGYY